MMMSDTIDRTAYHKVRQLQEELRILDGSTKNVPQTMPIKDTTKNNTNINNDLDNKFMNKRYVFDHYVFNNVAINFNVFRTYVIF